RSSWPFSALWTARLRPSAFRETSDSDRSASSNGASGSRGSCSRTSYRRKRRRLPPETPMPELPDLLYVVARLRERLLGRTVSSERVREPVVLRYAVRGNLSLLMGRSLAELV